MENIVEKMKSVFNKIDLVTDASKRLDNHDSGLIFDMLLYHSISLKMIDRFSISEVEKMVIDSVAEINKRIQEKGKKQNG